jgi:hypothetical protein
MQPPGSKGGLCERPPSNQSKPANLAGLRHSALHGILHLLKNNEIIGIFNIGIFDLLNTPISDRGAMVWVRPGDHKIVGDCLAAIRKRAGVTQQELARRLGKPQSFVSSYEQGQRRIDLLEFLLIVEALGADPRRVFAGILKRKES